MRRRCVTAAAAARLSLAPPQCSLSQLQFPVVPVTSSVGLRPLPTLVSWCPGSSFAGMSPVLLAAWLLALCTSGAAGEGATLRFLGQTNFVVNESSAAVVRLVVERVGDPVNVTALVLVGTGARLRLLCLLDSVLCPQLASLGIFSSLKGD